MTAGRYATRSLLPPAFACSALALAWLARAPEPANYAIDVLTPLVVLGGSVSRRRRRGAVRDDPSQADYTAAFGRAATLGLAGVVITRRRPT